MYYKLPRRARGCVYGDESLHFVSPLIKNSCYAKQLFPPSSLLPVCLYTLGWADLARLHGVRIEPGSITADQHHSTAAVYCAET